LRREYDRLVEGGEFDRERVELVRGVIVTMSPIGSRHAEVVARLTRLLVRGVEDLAVVRVQSPLAVASDSEPEPDLAVVPPGDYSDGHPERALLVIEVADTSLDYDRTDKARLYAEADIDEYWIVSLVDDTIEVHRRGRPDGHWEEIATAHRGVSVTPLAFADLAVAVDELLPRK
jgi:Uma2 family endonuclease